MISEKNVLLNFTTRMCIYFQTDTRTQVRVMGFNGGIKFKYQLR